MAATPIDKLASEIEKIVKDYTEDTTKTVKDLTKEFAKKGAKAVKASAAGAYGGGRYASGWTYTIEENRLGTMATIHNRTPGLPHLLEKGHAKRGGGRVPGREHIAPVEEELVTEFVKAVEKGI